MLPLNLWLENLEKSSTTKIGKHIPWGYSLSTTWAFGSKGNKHTLYHGQDCIKKFCSSLRKHAKNVINFEKKKILPLRKKQLKLHHNATSCYICGKKFVRYKNYWNFRDLCHYTGKYRHAAHSIHNLRFNVSNKISVDFHNGSNYNYHFITK